MKLYVQAAVIVDLVDKIQKEIEAATLQYLRSGRFEDDSFNIYDYVSQDEIDYWKKYWEKHPDEYEEVINEPMDDSLVEYEVDEDSYAVEVKITDDGRIFVEVRTELGDGVEYLEDALDPIIQKYDPQSYFDEEAYGVICAYLEV